MNLTVLAVTGITVGLIVLSGVMWTDDGKPVREFLFRPFTRDKYPPEVRKAEAERNQRAYQYMVEYLTMGFRMDVAEKKAVVRIEAEAAKAEETL